MKICLDLDSTLCDFCEKWMVWIYEKGFTNKIHSLEEFETYDWVFKKFGKETSEFFLKDPVRLYSEILEPYQGSKEFIENLKKIKIDFYVLTHSSQKETEEGKRIFCKKHFNIEKNIYFFPTLEQKYKFTGNSILIDDYPLHCLMHISNNKSPAIIFDHKNKNGWSKLDKYLDLIKKNKPNLNLLHKADNFKTLSKKIEKMKENY